MPAMALKLVMALELMTLRFGVVLMVGVIETDMDMQGQRMHAKQGERQRAMDKRMMYERGMNMMIYPTVNFIIMHKTVKNMFKRSKKDWMMG